MTYATPGDVAEDLRGSTSVSATEAVQWQKWLNRVENDIAGTFARSGLSLTEQVALDAPSAELVADVEVAAVVRKIQNPSWGRTSETRSLDDGSVTTRNESGSNLDPLDLIPSEIAKLLPARGRASRAFSVMPS